MVNKRASSGSAGCCTDALARIIAAQEELELGEVGQALAILRDLEQELTTGLTDKGWAER